MVRCVWILNYAYRIGFEDPLIPTLIFGVTDLIGAAFLVTSIGAYYGHERSRVLRKVCWYIFSALIIFSLIGAAFISAAM